MAQIDPADLDMIIAGTLTDTLMPSGGCTIQALLNANKAAAFDVCAACSGFVYGLAIADRFLKNDPDLNILVIGGELVLNHCLSHCLFFKLNHYGLKVHRLFYERLKVVPIKTAMCRYATVY